MKGLKSASSQKSVSWASPAAKKKRRQHKKDSKLRAAIAAANAFIPLVLLHVREDTTEHTLSPTAPPSNSENETFLQADILCDFLSRSQSNPCFISLPHPHLSPLMAPHFYVPICISVPVSILSFVSVSPVLSVPVPVIVPVVVHVSISVLLPTQHQIWSYVLFPVHPGTASSLVSRPYSHFLISTSICVLFLSPPQPRCFSIIQWVYIAPVCRLVLLAVDDDLWAVTSAWCLCHAPILHVKQSSQQQAVGLSEPVSPSEPCWIRQLDISAQTVRISRVIVYYKMLVTANLNNTEYQAAYDSHQCQLLQVFMKAQRCLSSVLGDWLTVDDIALIFMDTSCHVFQFKHVL